VPPSRGCGNRFRAAPHHPRRSDDPASKKTGVSSEFGMNSV
jgi:hypothetical protein